MNAILSATVDTLLDFSLLDYLAYRTGCPYLSDLPRVDKWEVKRAAARVPAEAFTVKGWIDAINYLTGRTDITPDSAADAKLLLLERLEGAA